ncbi:protein FAM221B isoform X5 [Sarcophilus harrisii]|uniref:protein FAM221B isoform X5 n=1 Tax=Sarcophilus harrisii TaxID=9305 RepID=UPI001301DF47|nr:protein FAM221B isoform X5 [Sarcophilus harrisii]XP_031801202.1 protein FAM221B isoform X5 [Sarcophilus harrisii]
MEADEEKKQKASTYEITSYGASAPEFPTSMVTPIPEEVLNLEESIFFEEPITEALGAEMLSRSSISEAHTIEKEGEAHNAEDFKSPAEKPLSAGHFLPVKSPKNFTSKDQEEQYEEGISDDHIQTNHQNARGKKTVKKPTSRYTARGTPPSDKPEVLAVAKAMHREKFGCRMKQLFQWEKDATLQAIQSGLYIGWRCPHYLWDCYRIGNESKCFCGHLLANHRIVSGRKEKDISVPCTKTACRCQMFCFIPSRPEEVGEFWLQKRSGFDPKAWRALCRCKHNHEEHLATGSHACRHRGCQCNFFQSNFLCAACDRRWEEHETFFESEETRRQGGRPIGEKSRSTKVAVQ